MAQRGGYPLAPKLPFSPGYDFVGKIIDPCNSVSFNKGDMVCAMLPTMGTYRERYIEVKEGGVVFIQGASGGVGISLSEIGKLKKLNMFGTASKAKHGFLKETGVIPINYQEDDFVKQ
jgi:NADPH:quinone reductase-like Zn-dependent oxidoreductase